MPSNSSPKSAHSSPDRPRHSHEFKPHIGRKKILLVEDNEMNRDMLSRRLERQGYQVIMAVDGQQGVALAGHELPALILMDMSLPVVDGWEATRQIRATGNRVPIIALNVREMR